MSNIISIIGNIDHLEFEGEEEEKEDDDFSFTHTFSGNMNDIPAPNFLSKINELEKEFNEKLLKEFKTLFYDKEYVVGYFFNGVSYTILVKSGYDYSELIEWLKNKGVSPPIMMRH